MRLQIAVAITDEFGVITESGKAENILKHRLYVSIEHT